MTTNPTNEGAADVAAPPKSKSYDPIYYQKNKLAYAAATRRLRAKRRAGRVPAMPRPALPLPFPDSELGKAITAFLTAKAGLADGTLAIYRVALNQFAAHVGDVWPVDADHVDTFLAQLKAKKRKKATIHAYYRVIKTMCAWLVRRRKISREDNPIEMAERPRLPKLLPRAPKEDRVQKLVTYLERQAAESWKGLRNIALVSLLIDSALRVSEACSLDIEDLDLRRRTVFLSETKTNFDGISVFSPAVASHLADYLTARAGLELPEELTGALFISSTYKGFCRLTGNGVRDLLTHACVKAGVQRLTPHAFRHFAAISSLQNGANALDVQHQLRHRDMRMTLRYLVISDDQGRPERHAGYSPFAKLGGAA
jgi:site-specific recombinase XerD